MERLGPAFPLTLTLSPRRGNSYRAGLDLWVRHYCCRLVWGTRIGSEAWKSKRCLQWATNVLPLP